MPARLLEPYAPVAARWDEMVDERGRPRAHWVGFLDQLAALPAGAMLDRSFFVDEALASDGVSHNAHAGPGAASRPWELDLLPLVLPADEWRGIAAAVAQRARLLDAVLRDVYGPQTLLAEGLIPPALVFGQRGFLWPAHGVQPPGGAMLHLYAADLARSPDGGWWVIADRTRGPAGAGYALQNRITLARALPDAFRELHVEPLAPFFTALSDSLFRVSPTHGEAPLAVLLTAGPATDTYFEHAFLARHLGFPLVEGQDLVVRGDSVYLKTLHGLRRVHAILRRLEDASCDPVELRADSVLGVPGLLHVVRAGNVVVANALGSGVLESGAFTAYHAGVSERLFGEELAMRSIATWWCGEEAALEHVAAHLDQLVVKPAYPSIRAEPVFGHTLDAAGRRHLLERVRAQPHAWVAQEWVRLSQAPTWSREGEILVPRAATIRVFAVSTPTGWSVLPGGLTRVAPHDGDVVSMKWGGSSKDTWILADRPVVRVPLRRPRLGVDDVVQGAIDIPSRVGEGLFWMGRYAERCEGLARLARAALVRLADAGPQPSAALASLVGAGARIEMLPAAASTRERRAVPAVPADPAAFLQAVVDPSVPGGVAANVARLHAASGQVRERMSTDNWHVLNQLPGRLPGPGATLGEALDALDAIMTTCVSLAGFALDDMTRDESWHFLLLGRRLERLAHLAAVVSHVLELPAPARPEALEWLLEAANGIVTYRARYRRAPELLPVVHLVVLDESNPHAVAFQLRELASGVGRLVAELGGAPASAALDAVHAALRATPLAPFEPERGEPLEEACRALSSTLAAAERAAYALSDDLQRRYFSHAATPAPIGIQAP